MRKLIILLTVAALGAACSDSASSLTDPASIGAASGTIAAADQLPAPVDVQFQDPVLAGPSAVFDVFEDPATGIRFRARTTFSNILINLLTNTGVATSACAPPENSDEQILGTGPVTQPGHSGAPIEALFPVPVPPNRVISVQFQAGTGAPVRIRLYDAANREVSTTMDWITDEAGPCGITQPAGMSRGRIVLQASAPVHVDRAVFDSPRLQPFGYVFAIDDLRIEPPRGRDNRPGGGPR